MKILVVHNRYQTRGGEDVAVEAQIELLRRRGHAVVVYGADNRVIAGYGAAEKILFVGRTLFSIKTYRRVRQLVQTERPDVAHVHNVFPLISPSVYWALRRANVPTVQTVHNFRFICPNGLLFTNGTVCERCKLGNTLHAVRHRCYRNSYVASALYALCLGVHRRMGTFRAIHRYVALTEFVAAKLVESGLTQRERVSVLGNFVSEDLPTVARFEDKARYVLYVGRLSEEKGIATMLRAVEGVRGLGVKIAGEGPAREALRELTIRLNLENVEFVGPVAGEEKWNLIRRAAAVVVPSIWYESFGIVVLEGFACGTPVIASRRGSLPLIVEDGRDGLLFESGDIPGLRARVVWAADHPRECFEMGRAGRAKVERLYSADAHHRSLLEIYSEVCRETEIWRGGNRG